MPVGVSFATQRPIEPLRASVDVLVSLDPADLSDVELAHELIALRHEMDRQEAVFARLAHAAHVRGAGRVDGAASTASWLRHRAGMREGDAKAAIEAGEVCDLLAETGEAWRTGEISTGSVRTIVGARVAEHDDMLAACESELLALARRGDLRSLRQAAAHFRKLAQADGTEPGAQDGLYLSRLYDGRTVISGELGDAAAETVTTALHAYVDPPSDDDTRTTPQRYVDALVQICKVALAHAGEAGRPLAQVSFVVDWKTFTANELGRMDGAFTGPIHPQDVERLLCDSSISRIVTGPDGLPLDVGRATRTPPPSVRRAIVARDQGCRFPGCNRPPGWCDAHHIVPWHANGTTERDNLILLCDHHHQVVHTRGWSITFDGHTLTVTRPDGTRVLE